MIDQSLDDLIQVEMNRREVILTLVFLRIRDLNDVFGLFGGLESLAELGLVFNVLLDNLIGLNVEHVVLNSQVSQRDINKQALLMVDQKNSGFEKASQDSYLSFFRRSISAKVRYYLDSSRGNLGCDKLEIGH